MPGKPQRSMDAPAPGGLLPLIALSLITWFAVIGAATVIRWLVG